MPDNEDSQQSSQRKTKLPILVVLIVVAFLMLLELTLWAGGKLSSALSESKTTPQSEQAVRVLCLGDAFTRGDEGETYPQILQELLESKAPGVFKVINQGYYEANSTELRNHLHSITQKYRPDVAVVLIGGTNLANPLGFHQYQEQKSYLASVEAALSKWVANRSITKIYRTIGEKSGANDVVETVPDDKLPKGQPTDPQLRDFDGTVFTEASSRACLDAQEVFKEYRRVQDNEETDPASPITIDLVLQWGKAREISDKNLELQGQFLKSLVEKDFDAAEEITRTLMAKGATKYRGCISDGYYNTARANFDQDPKLAVNLFLRTLAADPNDDDAYYWMVRAFDRQSEITANQVVEKLEEIGSVWGVEQSPYLASYIRLFKEQDTWASQVDQWVRDDLEDIVKTLQGQGINVVLQNYPAGYPQANLALADTAKKFSLPFVDNFAVFAGLDHALYIQDADNATNLGHRQIARNVLQVLEQMKLPGLK